MGYAAIIFFAALLFFLYYQFEVKPLKERAENVVEGWQVFQEENLLRDYGVLTASTAFTLASQKYSLFSDRLTWIGKNAALPNPSVREFKDAVRSNAEFFSGLCFNLSSSNEKHWEHLEEILTKCDQEHIVILHCLNKELNMSGAVGFGVPNLNYFDLAFFFIASYADKIPDFALNNGEYQAVRYGVKEEIIQEGQTWKDILDYSKFLMAVLDLDIPRENSRSATYVLNLLEGKVKTDLQWRTYQDRLSY